MQRRAAFTLVELLVVIGIIALLIAILLPTLGRAREQAKRVQCQSNLRSIGQGLTIYLNQSKGLLPVAPKTTGAGEEFDAWYWRAPGGLYTLATIGQSPLGKTLRMTQRDVRLLLCPSDVNAPARAPGKYPFSYAFNRFFNGNGPSPIKKVTECKNSSEKVWIYEEDGATIDDGNGEMWTTIWQNADLLSIRHDERGKKEPDIATSAGVPNAKRRGNVLFLDGHADYIPRSMCHAKKHAAPNPRRITGAEILILNN